MADPLSLVSPALLLGDSQPQTDEATLSRDLDVVPFDLDDTLRVHGSEHGEERHTSSALPPGRFDPYAMPWTTRTFLAPLALDAEAVISAWEVAEDARCGYALDGDDGRVPPSGEPLPPGDGTSRRSARALVISRKAAALAEVAPAAAWARLQRRVPFSRELLHKDLSISLRQCPPSLALHPHGVHASLPVLAPPLAPWRAAHHPAGGGGLSRADRVERYLSKRRSRSNTSIVRYQVRKTNAEARPRLNGRFIKDLLPVALCEGDLLLCDPYLPGVPDSWRAKRSRHAPAEFDLHP